MAGTTLKRSQKHGLVESPVRDLVIQLNALIANVDTITTAMDSDAGITGTGFAAMVTVQKIGNEAGTAISA